MYAGFETRLEKKNLSRPLCEASEDSNVNAFMENLKLHLEQHFLHHKVAPIDILKEIESPGGKNFKTLNAYRDQFSARRIAKTLQNIPEDHNNVKVVIKVGLFHIAGLKEKLPKALNKSIGDDSYNLEFIHIYDQDDGHHLCDAIKNLAMNSFDSTFLHINEHFCDDPYVESGAKKLYFKGNFDQDLTHTDDPEENILHLNGEGVMKIITFIEKLKNHDNLFEVCEDTKAIKNVKPKTKNVKRKIFL